MGATCNVITPIVVSALLPAGGSSNDVFKHARAVGVQIRGVTVRRTTMEDAFLQVINAAGATPPVAEATK
jgi:hypothetical protein